MRFIKPVDRDLIIEMTKTHCALVTVEEGTICGGAGSAVMETLMEEGMTIPVLLLGLPDKFIDHGDVDVLFERCGMDPASVRKKIDAMLKKICVNGACSA